MLWILVRERLERSCRDSSKGLLTSFECLVFLLYLWASINRIQVFRLRTTCEISATVPVLAAVFAWRASSICYLTIDVNRQPYRVMFSTHLISTRWFWRNRGEGVSKPIRNGEILWVNRVELQWGWVVNLLICYASPIESGTFQCYERVLPRDYATSWHKWWLSKQTVNKNIHWLEVIKTSVKCLLLTPCLMIIAVIS